MGNRILIVNGHPDPDSKHFNYFLADAYKTGALSGGHEVSLIQVSELSFPLLRSTHEYYHEDPPESVVWCQEKLLWANHVVFFFPLWMGGMPALLKALLEQMLRPGFAYEDHKNKLRVALLKGRSARIVVTMGMPAVAYRWFFGAHGVKNFKRNILKFGGIHPVKTTLIGGIESISDSKRRKWLNNIRQKGTMAN